MFYRRRGIWLLIVRCTYLIWLIPSCRASANDRDLETSASVSTVSPGSVTVSVVTDSNKEPAYEGLLVSQWLRAHTRINPDNLSLAALLKLKQVSPPDKLGIVVFEIPVSYESLTNGIRGRVRLGFFDTDGNFVEFPFADLDRATNGHCLLTWNINYNSPGLHNIRARLTYHDGWNTIRVIGPMQPFYSSNVCEFIEGSTLFNSTGAILEAQLPKAGAKYRIDLDTPNGTHLKTINGSTTNDMIDTDWDLKDEHDKTFEGDSFEGRFYVWYPGDVRTNAPAIVVFSRIGDPAMAH